MVFWAAHAERIWRRHPKVVYEALLILHFLGLAAGLGTSFFMAGLGIRTARMPTEDGARVMAAGSSVSGLLSGLSLLLLWGTGIALIAIYDGLAAAGGVLFHIKVGLVALLTLSVGLIHRQSARMRRGTAAPDTKVIERLGMAVLILGVAIVVLAVLAFG